MSKIEYNNKTEAELEAAKKQLEGDPNYEKPKETVEGGSLSIPLEEEEEQTSYDLPEKFTSQEELVKAYLELEKKMSSKEVQPKEEPKEEKEEQEEIAKASDKGVDFEALSNEYYANGELSPDTYIDLAKKGYSKEVVDTFIDGHKAKQEAQLHSLYELAGGRDAFDTAVDWASKSWDVEDIKAFNTIISSGDDDSIRFAVKSLMDKAKVGMTKNPNLMNGSPSSQTRGVFANRDEYLNALKDPRYRKDPAYRTAVDEKLTRSNFYK